MKKNYSCIALCFASALFVLTTIQLKAQNVGIGIALPVQKLHVGGSQQTVRVDGLTSTIANQYPVLGNQVVYATDNGDLTVIGPTTTPGNAIFWGIYGNNGITAANWIGTINAADFIIKTGNVERARVLSTGPTLFNETAATYANDLVESRASATFTNAISGITTFNNGSGVYGEFSTGAGTGSAVWGNSNNLAIGVYGTSTYLGGGAVQGQNAAGAGYGVVGINTTASGASTGIGVYGATAQSGGIGVFGNNSNAGGTGVRGQNNGASGAGAGTGVIGNTAQSGGFGVWGFNTHATGTGVAGSGNNQVTNYLVAGSGGAFTGTGTGSFDKATTVASGTGTVGVGNNMATGTFLTMNVGSGGAFSGTSVGAFGYSTNAGGTGMLGVCPGNFGAGWLNLTANGPAGACFTANGTGAANTVTGIAAFANSGLSAVAGTNFTGGYFATQITQAGPPYPVAHWAYVAYRTGGTNWKISGTGAVGTVVRDVNEHLVSMACPEAPEILFEDYGIGQLNHGHVHVVIDPSLAKNIKVSNDHPLKVFIQLEGNCNGVFVTNKSENGFDVVELNSGNSNVSFSYHIVATRADEYDLNGNLVSKYADLRFPHNEGPLPMTAQQMQAQHEIVSKNDGEPTEVKPVSTDREPAQNN